MSAYLLVRVKVHDRETYSQYQARTPGLIAQYGGRFIVRGGAAECLEGEGFDGRLVVIEFPDADAARKFFHSPEYQAAKAIREPVSTAEIILVEGVG